VSLLGAAPSGGPDAAADPRWSRAARLVDEGRCPAALPLLEALLEEAPDARVLAAQGRCQLRLREYPEAVVSLEAARAADPDLAGLDLPLAVARFHAGDLAGADEALRAAEAAQPDRPEVQLYRGLILLQRGEGATAASVLEGVRSADSDALNPIASYYEARAIGSTRDTEEAEAALQRVVEEHPDTPWAARAQEALDRMQGPRVRGWGWAGTGWEYDDNVTLRGAGVVLPSDISGQRDTRIVWNAGGGVEALLPRGFRLGGLVSYEGGKHRDLDDFDYHYPSFTGWLDRRVARDTIVRAQADLAYAWVDNKPFLGFQRYGGSLVRGWSRWGTSQAGAHWARYDYFFATEDVPDGPGRVGAACFEPDTVLCGPPGIDEEREHMRDGDELGLSLDHTLPLGFGDWALQGGYRYRHFNAPGTEYSHNAHEAILHLRGSLPLGLRLRVAGGYVYRPYRNASTFPKPTGLFFNRQYGLADDRRRDNDWRTEVALERDLGSHATLAARWLYRRNQSNVDVFDYERNILGVYLTVGVGD